MGLFIYLDGKFVDEKDAVVSVFDHGLLYGDGVFEGIRGYNGRVFKLDEHLNRLFLSAKAIMLRMPLGFAELKEAILETIRINELKDCYVRVVITRGVGDLGLDPLKCSNPTVFIIANKIKMYSEEVYTKGLSVVTVGTRRNINESVSPSIKSLNYLNNIMGKIEANNASADEGLMLNNEGYVTECTGENIFIVKGNSLLTPPLYSGSLDGITAGTVKEIAVRRGLNVNSVNLTRYDLFTADECFLTGTAAEIICVVSIDKRVLGEGKMGPVTKMIRDDYLKIVKEEGTSVY